MADGEIRLNTKLDNREFITGSKQLTTAIKSLQSTTTRIGKQMAASAGSYGAAMRKNISAVREFEQSMRGLEGEANLLRSKMAELGKTKLATNEYKRVVDGIAKAEREYDVLLAKKKQFEAEKVAPATMDALYESMGKTEDRLNDLRIKQQQMLDAGHAYKYGSDTAEYRGMQDRLSDIQDALRETEDLKNKALQPPYLKNWNEMLTMSSMVSNAFGKLQYAAGTAFTAIQHPIQAVDRALGFLINKVWQTVSSFAKMAGNAAISYLKRLAAGARNAAIQLAKLAASAVSSGIKKIGSAALYAARAVLGLNKNTKSSGNSLKQNLTTILKYGFGIRSLFFLFRRLRTAVSDGLGEISKQSPALKSAMNSMQTACSALKGSLASAFAPIYTAIAPAIVYLINLLSSAITTIASFFSALTGNTTVAKSIGTIGSSAKKSGGAVKDLKKELAGFDTLNILNDKNSGGGGGGGGSGAGMAYTTEQIESSIQEFVDKLKTLWTEGRYEEIGWLIAEGINKAFEKAKTLISWENVSDTVEDAITAVAGVFNGLIDPQKGIDFNLIGETFGAGVNTIINTINLLFSKINLFNIGVALANLLNGAVSQIDPDALGQVLTTKIRAMFAIVKGFVRKFQWGEAGTKFGQTFVSVFKNLDIGSYGTTIAELINGVIDSAANALKAIESDPEFADGKAKFADALNNFANTVGWTKLGDTFAGWMAFVLRRAKAEILRFDLSAYGTGFARTLNVFFKRKDLWQDAGETINTTVAKMLEFGQSFLDTFDSGAAAEGLKTAIGEIDFEGIAKQAWTLFKTAIAKFGNFLNVLFGGEDLDEKPFEKAATDVNEAINEKLAQKNGLQIDAGLDTSASGIVAGLINAITAALGSIEWAKVGGFIHDALFETDWLDVGKKIGKAIFDGFVELLSDLRALILSALLGEEGFKELDAPEYDLDADAENYVTAIETLNNAIETSLQQGSETLLIDADLAENLEISQESIDAAQEELTERWDKNKPTGEIDVKPNFGLDDENYMYWVSSINEALDAAMQSGHFDAQMLIDIGFPDSAIPEVEKQFISQWNAEHPDAAMLHFDANSLQTLGEDTATDVVDGYVDGIESDNRPEEAGMDIGNSTIDGLRTATDSHSPSRVFREIGIDIVSGLVEGLDTLPNALRQVWNNLPEWAKTMFQGGSVGIGISASTGGTTDSAAGKRQTKATKDLTKELRKKKATAEIDVNLDGNEGLQEIASGKATTTVQVGFVPEGQQDEEEPTGLLAWLQQLFDPGVSTDVKVNLIEGAINGEASDIISLAGKAIAIAAAVALGQGTWNASAWTVITSAGKALAAITGKANLAQGATWFAAGWTVITNAGKTLANTVGKVILEQGPKWFANGWSVISNAGKTFTTTVSSILKQGGTWFVNGFKAMFADDNDVTTKSNVDKGNTWLKDAFDSMFAGDNEVTTTVDVKDGEVDTTANKAIKSKTSTTKTQTFNVKNGSLDTTSKNAVNADKNNTKTETFNVKNGKLDTTSKNAVNAKKTNTKTETIDVKNGKMDATAKNAVNANSNITKTIKVGLEIDPNKKEVKLSGGISKGSWYLESRAIGGIINAFGKVRNFASGGAIMRNGRSSWWNSVNKYAAGTSRAHGTVFVAGENGPEIMGHVNGRTEILNKSQLADALYGAVVSGMSQAVNALGAYIVNHMTVCTNAIVSTIAANSLPTYGLSSYYAPAMASGAIMPYEVAAQIARSTADIQNTLDTNNEELIQAMVSAISNAAASIVMAMNLHGNNNNAPLTARAMSNAVIDEINRRTRMTGQSPLMGV